MATFGLQHICFVYLSLSLIFGILSCIINTWLVQFSFSTKRYDVFFSKLSWSQSSQGLFRDSAGGLCVSSLFGLALVITLEGLRMWTRRGKESSAVRGLSLVVCLASVCLQIAALSIISKPTVTCNDSQRQCLALAHNDSFLLLTVSMIFCLQALVFQVLNWRSQQPQAPPVSE